MRTTVTLESDVANKIKEYTRENGATPKVAINELIRHGFFAIKKSKQEKPSKPFKITPVSFGLHPKLRNISMNHLAVMSDEEIDTLINS